MTNMDLCYDLGIEHGLEAALRILEETPTLAEATNALSVAIATLRSSRIYALLTDIGAPQYDP